METKQKKGKFKGIYPMNYFYFSLEVTIIDTRNNTKIILEQTMREDRQRMLT